VRLRAALANSYNVPAVRLAERLGTDAVVEVLRRAGFESLSREASHYGVGVVLGNGDVSLWELARATAASPRGVVEPLLRVRSARDAGRLARPDPDLSPRPLLPSAATALLNDILSDVARAHSGLRPGQRPAPAPSRRRPIRTSRPT
jgi:penicillin-binding protein 1C